MQEEETSSTSSAEKPSKESKSAALQEVWVELNRSEEGVGLSLYRQYEDGEIIVEDEAWWTWGEFTGMATTELNISKSGSTRMDAVQSSSILSPGNILDTIHNSPFTLVNYTDLANRPECDDLPLPAKGEILAALERTT